MLPQRSKHPREMVITPKASTSIFELGPIYLCFRPLCPFYPIIRTTHEAATSLAWFLSWGLDLAHPMFNRVLITLNPALKLVYRWTRPRVTDEHAHRDTNTRHTLNNERHGANPNPEPCTLAAFTRYYVTSKLVCTSPSSFDYPRPPTMPTLLQCYCNPIAKHTTLPRPSLCVPYTIQYCEWQYRVKANLHPNSCTGGPDSESQTNTHTQTDTNTRHTLNSERRGVNLKGALQLLINRYGYTHFAQVPARVSTQSFVVLIMGNSKSNHLGAQGTFNPEPCSGTCLQVDPTASHRRTHTHTDTNTRPRLTLRRTLTLNPANPNPEPSVGVSISSLSLWNLGLRVKGLG